MKFSTYLLKYVSSDPTDFRVLLDVKNKIAFVTLNRPDKHNGLDEQMFVALVKAARLVRKDRNIRCVILLKKERGQV